MLANGGSQVVPLLCNCMEKALHQRVHELESTVPDSSCLGSAVQAAGMWTAVLHDSRSGRNPFGMVALYPRLALTLPA